MIKRIVYSILQAWRQRKALCAVYRDSNQQVPTLLQLNCEKIYAAGIRVLILDFDGVMAWHGATEPLSEINTWLRTAIQRFGEERIFILSNNPMPCRKAYFTREYPQLRFVSGIRKKPYPDGVLNISQMTNLPCAQMLVVDDRLLTGVLAAVLAESKVVLLTSPYVSWRHATLPEAFFWMLRKIERLLFG